MLGVKIFILLYLVYVANAQYRRLPPRQLSTRSEPEESPSYNDDTKEQAVSPSQANPATTTSVPSRVGTEINSIIISKRPNVNSNEQPPINNPNEALFNKKIPPRRVSWNLKPGIQLPETNAMTTEPVPLLEMIKKSTSTETDPDDESELKLDPEINGPDSELAHPNSNERHSQPDPEPNESDLNDNSELASNLELEPEQEPKSEPKPVPEEEQEPKLDPKSEPVVELEPKLKPEPKPKEPAVPGIRGRSPFTEPKTGSKPEETSNSKPKIEGNGNFVSKPNNYSNDIDFKCSEKNKYYEISNSCDKFFECQKFIPKIKTCPDGLLFDSKAVWPRYPCSYPSEVECGNSTYTRTHITAPTGECPRRFGSFPTSANDCEKYIVCENGRPSLMNCPMGLGFNSKIGACDWPANIPNCNPQVFKDFECPVPPRRNKPDKVYNYRGVTIPFEARGKFIGCNIKGLDLDQIPLTEGPFRPGARGILPTCHPIVTPLLFRYKNSCKLYITCLKGEPRLLRCDSGLSFDDRSSRCISSAAVSNCKKVSEIVDTKLFINKS